MDRDTLQSRLICLHDTKHMTWREIAAMEEFGGVAAGTLCSISKGYMPKKLTVRRKLGIHEPELIEQYRDPLGRFT